MIAIYNPNSDPTLQNLPLPTDTEIAEFEDIAGFLEFLDNKRAQIETIILSNQLMCENVSHATPQNIATVKRLLPHTNHHREIISSTYGTEFTKRKVYSGRKKEPNHTYGGELLLAKLLTKDYANTSPYDVGNLVGHFAGKVNFLFDLPLCNGPYYRREYVEKLHRYFHGLGISINNQKLS